MKTFDLLLTKYWQITYVIFSLGYICSSILISYPLMWLVKILPLVLLITYLCFRTSFLTNRIDWTLLCALVFSMLGDFILDFEPKDWFVFGLASFLIAHIFYTLRMGRWKFNNLGLFLTLTICSYGFVVCYLLYPNLGQLKVPVLAYMAILLVMCLSSFFTKQTNSWIVTGGLAFVISDSVLGINKFYQSFEYSSLIIMSTYYTAQFCLFNGLINKQKFSTS